MWLDLSQLSITSHHRQNSTPSLLITSLKLTAVRFTPFFNFPASELLSPCHSVTLEREFQATSSPQQLTPRFQLRSKLDPTLCPSITTFKVSLSLFFHLLPLFLLEIREQCCVDASPCPTTLTPPISSFFPPAHRAAHRSAGTQDRPTVVPAHGTQHREAGSGGASEGEEG